MPPAATVDLFKKSYLPVLDAGKFGVDRMHVYNLNEKLELDDNVGQVYRKSLLYLVSRAFEEKIDPPESLLGMQLYSKKLEKPDSAHLFFHYSDGPGKKNASTTSTSHGGFDNDPATMNSVLKTVLDKPTMPYPFTKDSLDY